MEDVRNPKSARDRYDDIVMDVHDFQQEKQEESDEIPFRDLLRILALNTIDSKCLDLHLGYTERKQREARLYFKKLRWAVGVVEIAYLRHRGESAFKRLVLKLKRRQERERSVKSVLFRRGASAKRLPPIRPVDASSPRRLNARKSLEGSFTRGTKETSRDPHGGVREIITIDDDDDAKKN
eukprot:TRINITY_DN3007_c1_g1_i1.p1 TRINITY_DN3007_c1_g1~~TRINITY_DN3007_c1_g1_i1.p1  ORF type:complete len:212 (+),score=57.92 TRINITY_DN3007_c1_g1_i1:95-637(+)